MDYTRYLSQKQLRFYRGANGNKKSIRLENGDYYMLKFPPGMPQDKRQDLSYKNSCFSEYIGCHIMELLGLEAQETYLGTVRLAGKEKIVVACKDFNVDGYFLQEFAAIKNGCINTSQNGYGTELEEVLEAIREQEIYPAEETEEFFWELFIADTLLGNFDRHNGNWGFLINERKGDVKLAPVFDCGSCLYPQLSDEGIKMVLRDSAEIDKRIYQFPTSALKQKDRKIHMGEFLLENDYPGCKKALIKLSEQINFHQIDRVVEETPYLSDIRKEFYKKMLRERCEKLLLPAYQKVKKYSYMDIGEKVAVTDIGSFKSPSSGRNLKI